MIRNLLRINRETKKDITIRERNNDKYVSRQVCLTLYTEWPGVIDESDVGYRYTLWKGVYVMEFIKMHGLGNDFILINALPPSVRKFETWSGLARRICHRNFGVGADGLIIVLPSGRADFKMRIFNPDGSEAEMCGNGIRCFARYVFEAGLTTKTRIEVETGGGIIRPEVIVSNGSPDLIRVDMGRPSFQPRDVPVDLEGEAVISRKVNFGQFEYPITCVSMGNPHCVIFVEDLDAIDICAAGPIMENASIFPRRTNVEFVRILDQDRIKVRVWERGAGMTMACGTGACASLVAAAFNKLTGRKAEVRLPGGSLDIEWHEDDHVYMTGPAVPVFEGVLRDEILYDGSK